jgi:regulatory protein
VADLLQHALGLAYAYLNRRERSVSEVRLRLEREGVEEHVVEQALAVMSEDGYLDDRRFARLFVQDKRELAQWGAERIKRGLQTRGVEREVIEEALADAHADADGTSAEGPAVDPELGRALALLTHRFPTPPRDRRERDRALGVLIRRGYDPEVALDALTAYGRGE